MQLIRRREQHQSSGKILREKISCIFKARGTVGKCIEGREFIIVLPESVVEYKADDVVRLFTDSFNKKYDVECSAALHHNKRMTNYHIHLVFSERKMLEHPEVKLLPEICFMMNSASIDA